LRRHEAVSLHLLWADFGAGKTHTLLYFKQEAERAADRALLPLYCALPKGCRAFLDIYRAMIRAITVQQLRTTYEQACKNLGRSELHTELDAISRNLTRCLQVIAIGGEEQQAAALAWLHGETGVPVRELQRLSIFGRVKSADEAVLSLCGIVRLFNIAGF